MDMPDALQIASFMLASPILGIMPWRDIIYVIVRGAAQGPRAGLAAAAGGILMTLGLRLIYEEAS